MSGQRSIIIAVIVLLSLSLSYGTVYAKYPGNRGKDKPAAALKSELRKAKKEVKEIARQEKKEEVKQKIAEKRNKEKMKKQEKENRIKGTKASELKQDNRSRENKGRENAVLRIKELLDQSTRKMLDGLQNAFDAIGRWFGFDKVGSNSKIDEILSEE